MVLLMINIIYCQRRVRFYDNTSHLNLFCKLETLQNDCEFSFNHQTCVVIIHHSSQCSSILIMGNCCYGKHRLTKWAGGIYIHFSPSNQWRFPDPPSNFQWILQVGAFGVSGCFLQVMEYPIEVGDHLTWVVITNMGTFIKMYWLQWHQMTQYLIAIETIRWFVKCFNLHLMSKAAWSHVVKDM